MRILFLGEGDLYGPARYLTAVLKWSGMPFDHRPDAARIPKVWRQKYYDVVVLSDYRYKSWMPCAREWLIRSVMVGGTGLVMIGGWASFTGLVGGYGGTDIEQLLPVTCLRGDDRVQNSTGSLLLPIGGSPARNPPMICGYHRAKPKPGSVVSYEFRDIQNRNGKLALSAPRPALVRGRAGRAKTAAFLTDCAPHWAGGLVDWGTRRITIKLGGGLTVELGETYLKFFRDLILETALER